MEEAMALFLFFNVLAIIMPLTYTEPCQKAFFSDVVV
jgi:hypothetical protein